MPENNESSNQKTGYKIFNKQVSFSKLATIYYSAKTNLLSRSPDEKKRDAEIYPEMRSVFEATYGKIIKEYFGDNVVSATVLTEKGYLSAIHNSLGSVEGEIILLDCCNKSDEVYRLLKNDDRYRCNDEYYGVISRIIEYFDKNILKDTFDSNSTTDKKELKTIKFLFDQANNTFERTAQRLAKIEYFKGMVIGALFAVFSIITLILFCGFDYCRTWFVPFALLSGGGGALVSVMYRMSFGKLTLDFHSGVKLLKLFGGFRIVIGAILGLAMCVILRAGILPLKTPENPIEMIYFSSAIAFLAGFGERWAQDMLIITQKSVSDK